MTLKATEEEVAKVAKQNSHPTGLAPSERGSCCQHKSATERQLRFSDQRCCVSGPGYKYPTGVWFTVKGMDQRTHFTLQNGW